MEYLLWFSFGIFTAYLLLIYILFGWIASISQSYYEFKERYGNKWTWLFTVTLVLFAFPIMIYGLTTFDSSNFQFLFFLTPMGIIFTAVAPQFKESLTNRVHYVGAVVGIISGMFTLLLILNLYMVVCLWLATIGLIWLLKLNNRTYWIEVVSFYTIIICLLLN